MLNRTALGIIGTMVLVLGCTSEEVAGVVSGILDSTRSSDKETDGVSGTDDFPPDDTDLGTQGTDDFSVDEETDGFPDTEGVN